MYTLRHYTPDEDRQLIETYVPSWRRMRGLADKSGIRLRTLWELSRLANDGRLTPELVAQCVAAAESEVTRVERLGKRLVRSRDSMRGRMSRLVRSGRSPPSRRGRPRT